MSRLLLSESAIVSGSINASALRSRYCKQLFSSSSLRKSYGDTIKNLLIGSHTRVMYQGFTGKGDHATSIWDDQLTIFTRKTSMHESTISPICQLVLY
jgi:hypothetical protein